MLDKTTLIAASIPLLLLIAVLIFLVVSARRNRPLL